MDMLNNDLIRKSKYVSYKLRHDPEFIDEKGWCDVERILQNYKSELGFTFVDLESIVINNDKKRFEFNNDQTKIRAVQGHSVDVNVEMQKKIPPSVLYHGTKTEFHPKIKKKGLLPMNRQYVHLTENIEAAMEVANRRKGESILLKIDCIQMVAKDYKFFLSKNEIWLVDCVPPEFIY